MKVTDHNYSNNIHYYSEEAPELLLEAIHKYNPKNIIDLGCGDGAILYALKKKGLLKNKKVTAVDISNERVERAKQIDNDFECITSDACFLPKKIKNNYFDLIINSQVIEHIDNQKKLLEEINRIQKKGGILYLGTVFKKKYAWYFYRNNNKWVLDPTHIREYTNDNQLLPLIVKHGFKIIAERKKIFWFPLADFFVKRLGGGDYIYNNKAMKLLRKIKLPIIGYYIWEIVAQKNKYV